MDNNSTNKFRARLKDLNIIVIKIGTSTLTYDNGKLNYPKIDKIARVVTTLSNMGKKVILVSSGAIGVGISQLNYKIRPKTTKEKQALAAVGQCQLMNSYSKLFGEYNQTVGQILLTKDVVDNEIRKKHITDTFETLLEMDIIPIVNENDSVSVEEIEFGDNDNLSAIVAKIVKAELLIILSDIEGLYDKNPKVAPKAKLIKEVISITTDIEEYAMGAISSCGTGGMVTKIEAAKLATSEGIDVIITCGENPNDILDIIEGKDIGTLFIGSKFIV